MSSAINPLGMKSMPASGYNHNSLLNNKQYVTWKGHGINNFPVGSASGHIRPLTNKDPGNIFQTGFGLPRPIKHFRKGRIIMSPPVNNVENINEANLIEYNINRFVKSSKSTTLGGYSGLINDMIDKPGAYIVKQNTVYDDTLKNMCENCNSIGVVVNYQPNTFYSVETPNLTTTNKILCCNQEQKAKRRSLYASTNLKKNYYTTSKQYLQNRCKTYEQKSFNFMYNKINNSGGIYYTINTPYTNEPNSKIIPNTYLANCQLNSLLQNSANKAFINLIATNILNDTIITQQQFDEINSLNITTLSQLFNWLKLLPEPQQSSAINIFNMYINNPYINNSPLNSPYYQNGCQLTVYKPSNAKFANQGAVNSSTRTLDVTVNTITSNSTSISDNNLLKNKAPKCNMKSNKYQNKKMCFFA